MTILQFLFSILSCLKPANCLCVSHQDQLNKSWNLYKKSRTSFVRIEYVPYERVTFIISSGFAILITRNTMLGYEDHLDITLYYYYFIYHQD